MKWIVIFAVATILAGCPQKNGPTPEADIEKFFASVDVENGRPAALKKLSPSLGVTSYLLTVHGYADNLSVCNELIRAHENSGQGNVVDGSFRCELIPRKN